MDEVNKQELRRAHDLFETASKMLSYDPNNGEFTWLQASARRNDLVGTTAGSLNNSGYCRIMIQGKAYLAHRLAFLLMTGRMPKKHVDHINGVRTDNRWENLREADSTQNGRNQRLRRDSKLGLMGVYWSDSRNSFQVCIGISDSGRRFKKPLGRFKSLLDAAAARKSAELRYGFHQNHGTPARAL